MNIWFGEHTGKEISELSDDYLVWLTEKASSPITPNHFTDEEKRKVKERWKDLLSEVEDEINERQNQTERNYNYFA